MAVNKIVYGSYTFNDDELISVTLNLEEAPVQSALAADQLVFKVRSSASGKELYTLHMADYTQPVKAD